MRRAHSAVLACTSCARSFVVTDGRGALAAMNGHCPACGTGRWRVLGPEWPRIVERLRSLLRLSGPRRAGPVPPGARG